VGSKSLTSFFDPVPVNDFFAHMSQARSQGVVVVAARVNWRSSPLPGTCRGVTPSFPFFFFDQFWSRHVARGAFTLFLVASTCHSRSPLPSSPCLARTISPSIRTSGFQMIKTYLHPSRALLEAFHRFVFQCRSFAIPPGVLAIFRFSGRLVNEFMVSPLYFLVNSVRVQGPCFPCFLSPRVANSLPTCVPPLDGLTSYAALLVSRFSESIFAQGCLE